MENVSHKKTWNAGVTQVHMETLMIPLIKSKHKDKSDKDFVKLKVRRYTTSERSDLYEVNMPLFENGELEAFLFFVRNFNMTLVALGILVA